MRPLTFHQSLGLESSSVGGWWRGAASIGKLQTGSTSARAKLGPRQLGPGQFGPRQLGPTQLIAQPDDHCYLDFCSVRQKVKI